MQKITTNQTKQDKQNLSQNLTKKAAKKEKTQAMIKNIKQARGLKKMWLCIVFGALLLLDGGVVEANPPKWFLTPKSASDTLYGLGSGDSLAKAKIEAANDLAQSVQTQVKSRTNITNSAQNDRFESNVEQNISLSSAMLDLQNLKITQKSHSKGVYYVEVSIAKKDIAMPIKSKLEQGVERLESLPKSCSSLSLKDFALLQKELKQARESSAILRALGFVGADFEEFEELEKANLPKPKLKVEILFEGDNAGDKNDKSAFLGEVAKFARIANEPNTHTLYIEANTTNAPKSVSVEVKAVMKDCADNVLWEASFSETQANKAKAFSRAGVVLYKKLLDFSGGTQSGIPKI